LDGLQSPPFSIHGVGVGVGDGVGDSGAAIPGAGATIDLTRGNIEPIANPPTNVALLIIFRRETRDASADCTTGLIGCHRYS